MRSSMHVRALVAGLLIAGLSGCVAAVGPGYYGYYGYGGYPYYSYGAGYYWPYTLDLGLWYVRPWGYASIYAPHGYYRPYYRPYWPRYGYGPHYGGYRQNWSSHGHWTPQPGTAPHGNWMPSPGGGMRPAWSPRAGGWGQPHR